MFFPHLHCCKFVKSFENFCIILIEILITLLASIKMVTFLKKQRKLLKVSHNLLCTTASIKAKTEHAFIRGSTIWGPIFLQSSVPNDPTFVQKVVKNFWTLIYLWPASQWVLSLASLVLMYWLIGSWYNKRLEKIGGWISWQTRVYMIAIDLALNLCLGLYYVDMRDTLMGQLMCRCPIAVSPAIFFLEFVAFAIYYRLYVLKKKA